MPGAQDITEDGTAHGTACTTLGSTAAITAHIGAACMILGTMAITDTTDMPVGMAVSGVRTTQDGTAAGILTGTDITTAGTLDMDTRYITQTYGEGLGTRRVPTGYSAEIQASGAASEHLQAHVAILAQVSQGQLPEQQRLP